jgi:hypothetical protein
MVVVAVQSDAILTYGVDMRELVQRSFNARDGPPSRKPLG